MPINESGGGSSLGPESPNKPMNLTVAFGVRSLSARRYTALATATLAFSALWRRF